MKPHQLEVTSFRLEGPLKATLEREANDLGINLTDYLRVIVVSRFVKKIDAEQVATNIQQRMLIESLQEQMKTATDFQTSMERTLGPEFRKSKGQKIRIRDTDEVITVNTMVDFAEVLAKLIKISDDDED